jgi:mono/diheme cytochrome c family protein
VRSRREDLYDWSEMPGSAHTVSIADDLTSYVMENSIHARIPPNAKESNDWPRRNSRIRKVVLGHPLGRPKG